MSSSIPQIPCELREDFSDDELQLDQSTPQDDSQFALPKVDEPSDEQLTQEDTRDLLRRLIGLQQGRSLTYALYHSAFAALIQAAEQAALEDSPSSGGDHRCGSPATHTGHACGGGGGEGGGSQPQIIDPKKVKPAFEAFSRISISIARHFQLISTRVIQVERQLLGRADQADLAPEVRSSARGFAGLVRQLQVLEQRKLEATVRQQAIVSRHRVIQHDPFGEEFSRLSAEHRRALGDLVERINEVLSELRSEIFAED